MSKNNFYNIFIGIILICLILPILSSATEEKAEKCNYCHSKLGITPDDPDCELCHIVVRNPEAHQAQICHTCHNITDSKSYHIAHVNTTCITCHQTGKLPPKTYSNCLSCHISLHKIHNNCSDCHSSSTINNITTPKIYKPFSLYEIILELLKGLKWIK